jgi:hypothetical protein
MAKVSHHKNRARTNPFTLSERIKRAQASSLTAYTSKVTLPQAPWDDETVLTPDQSAAYDDDLGR